MRKRRPVSSNFDSYRTSASAVLPHPSPSPRGAASQHPRWEHSWSLLGAPPVQARVDTQSGKICRVVDIAEAPWRVKLEAEGSDSMTHLPLPGISYPKLGLYWRVAPGEETPTREPPSSIRATPSLAARAPVASVASCAGAHTAPTAGVTHCPTCSPSCLRVATTKRRLTRMPLVGVSFAAAATERAGAESDGRHRARRRRRVRRGVSAASPVLTGPRES